MSSRENLDIFKKFKDLVEKIGVKKALKANVNQVDEDPLEAAIFGSKKTNPDLKDSAALASLTFGDLIFDMARVDPAVVSALDFSRKQSIEGTMDFASYVQERVQSSGEISLGEFSQIKGYVAEQYVSVKLQAQGYEVEFPETANQAGFDLIVDGEAVQVKCGATLGLLSEHFEKYPDIPVMANSELVEKAMQSGSEWASQVFAVEGYDLGTIEDMTSSSIDAGAEVFDYEIPLFVAGVSSARNAYGWWKGDFSLGDALANAAVDVGTKVPLAGAGALAGQGLGILLFGPAGGVVFGGVMAVAGASQSRKVLAMLKTWLNKEAAEKLQMASNEVLDLLHEAIGKKIKIIKRKAKEFDSKQELEAYLVNRLREECAYFEERRNETISVRNKYGDEPTELAIKTFDLVRRSKVHPALFQKELEKLLRIFEEAQKSVKGWPKLVS